MREHHIEVTRTARYYTLGEAGPGVDQVWVVCHGYGQLAGRFLRRFQCLDDGRRLIVAPEALSRYYLDDRGGSHGPDARIGATWMTREDRLVEIDDYVRYLDRLHDHLRAQLDRERIETAALGFSQGAATASRWAAMGRARLDRLILWAGGPPPDLDLPAARERLTALELTIVLGRDDAQAPPDVVTDHEARLRSAAIDYRLVRFDGGHHLDDAVLAALAQRTPGRGT